MKAINLENQKFGYLTAKTPLIKKNKRYYFCICDCGKEIERTVSQLRAGGQYQSCGCQYKAVYENLHNLVGDRFGDLSVVKRIGTHTKSKSVLYECHCHLCGKQCQVTSKSLLRKHKLDQHCGCAGYPNKRLPGDQGIINKLIGGYKSNAKKRDLRFLLSPDNCIDLFKKECFYCGIEPKQIFTHRKCRGEYIYNGIDRVDSDLEYSLSNCVSCCTKCNFAKSNSNGTDFFNWIEKIYNHTINSKYSCNFCKSKLKQVRFDGDDKILECPNCRFQNNTMFELRFDYYGELVDAFCVAYTKGKYYILSISNDENKMELCIVNSLNSVYEQEGVYSIEDLTIDRINNILLFK